MVCIPDEAVIIIWNGKMTTAVDMIAPKHHLPGPKSPWFSETAGLTATEFLAGNP